MFVNFCSSCSMQVARRSSSIRSFQSSAALLTTRNYYEILGLTKDCSQKDIRDAFVVLSKTHHPDTNLAKSGSNTQSDQEFIRLMEAYQVLSKTHSRANYDLSLRGINSVNYVSRDTMYEPWKVDPSSYAEKGPYYSPYYGVKGVKRISNWKIVAACVMFCAFGVMLQTIAITRSVTFKREQLDRSSAAYNLNYEKAQAEAAKNGNEMQIERLKQRIRKSGLEYDKD